MAEGALAWQKITPGVTRAVFRDRSLGLVRFEIGRREGEWALSVYATVGGALRLIDSGSARTRASICELAETRRASLVVSSPQLDGCRVQSGVALEGQSLQDRIDQEMPYRGACGMCGSSDARHRVLDAVTERARAGDSLASLAADYNLSVELLERLAAEWVIEEAP